MSGGAIDETAARPSAALAARMAGIEPGVVSLVRLGTRAVYRLGDGRVLARVAAVAQRDGAAYELTVARWLAAAGVPVDEPFDGAELYEDPGFVVTLWKFREGDWGTTIDLAAVLRSVHHVLHADGLSLRAWDPFAEMRCRLVETHVLSSSEKAGLRARVDESEEAVAELEFVLPRGVIHGDASVGNILRTADGDLVLYDLEGVCWGPREWDLIITAVYRELGWHTEAEYDGFAVEYGFDIRAWAGYTVMAAAQRLRMICWLAGRACSGDLAEAELRARLADLGGVAPGYRWKPL